MLQQHPYSYSDEQSISGPGAMGLTSTETKVNHSLVSLHPLRTDCEVFEEETDRRDVVFSQLKDNICRTVGTCKDDLWFHISSHNTHM